MTGKVQPMPPLELPIRVFGRAVRPVAIGLSSWCIALIWYHQSDQWHSISEALLGWVSLAAVVLFVVAWVFRSNRTEMAALLCVTYVSVGEVALIGWTEGGIVQSRVLLAAGTGAIAAGSFWLESLDPRGRVRGCR